MSNLAKLDHLALAIAAPEIPTVGLLWGGSTKSSVAEDSIFFIFSKHINKTEISWGHSAAT